MPSVRTTCCPSDCCSGWLIDSQIQRSQAITTLCIQAVKSVRTTGSVSSTMPSVRTTGCLRDCSSGWLVDSQAQSSQAITALCIQAIKSV